MEEYKETQKKGTKLNEDQLLAVSKYEEVIRQLELSRELEKQFIGLANDVRNIIFFLCLGLNSKYRKRMTKTLTIFKAS